ncbi:hypothetical protein HMPREF3197_00806 [Klebsiella pneumoniae]|nr:hypothetical protein HMPREF3197_00806 [Klebsiella pneumoniae]
MVDPLEASERSLCSFRSAQLRLLNLFPKSKTISILILNYH